MATRSEDLAFSRYRQTGRAEFLGQVFDETAPGLLLVACHLLRGAESAEDLVQSTFVTAIEVADRYDATQPVFRWLAGILANHARVARRQAQRPLDTARLPAEPSAAPDAEAEAGEIAAAVTDALDALPETYRTVLVLRLLHGLEPIEVAHALGRSPETVRTQLHRGLAKLRAALPGSLTLAALATVVLDGRGLAAVRASVMGRVAAPAMTGTAAATAFGGLFMANKMIVAAACAVLLLGGAAVWRVVGAAGGSGGDEHAAPPMVAAAESRAAKDPEARATSEAARMPVADAPALVPSDATVLTGRCVDAEQRTPLAGCTVTVEARVRRGAPAPSWYDPVPQTTGPDGGFRFRFVLPEGGLLTASVAHPGRVPVKAIWEHLAAASTLDVGDVCIPLGVQVRGQVVDEVGGKAIAKAGIAAELAPLPFGSQPGEHDRASVRSDAGGWFDLGTLPVGEHSLGVLERDYQLVSPKRVVLTGMDRVVEQRVVLRATPFLHGTVVDPAGVPIAGISVSEWPDSSGAPTNARGEFHLYARDGSRPPVRLQFGQFPTVLEPVSVQPTGPWSWGTRDIRVTLPRPDPKTGSGARLRVVDAATGAAIEEFGYICKPDQTRLRGGSTSLWNRKQESGRHEHGIVELSDLHPTPHLAVVYPADGSLLAGGPVFFEVQRGAVAEVEVRLRRPADFRVQVVRRDGGPVSGAEVELLHAFGPTPVSLETRAMPMEQPGMSSGPTHLALLRATSATGSDGIAVLRAPAGEVGMTVRVLPVECLGHLVRDVAIPATQTEPLRVVVDSGATLRGRVVPADVVQRMARRDPPRPKAAGLILLAPSGDARLRLPTFGDCFPVADDGSFRISGVPPGAWSLHLYWLAPLVEGASSTHWFRPALATVTVGEGQEKELELDARAFRPASVRGRILLGDQPVANTTWCLFPHDGGFGGPGIGGLPTDADGRFHSDAVVPGRYSLAVLPGKPRKSGRTWRQVVETLEVGPGGSVDRTFNIAPTASLTVLLVAADGATPVVGHTLLWLASLGGKASMTFSGELTTDASGTVRLDPVLALPVQFHREPNEAERELPWEEKMQSTLLGTVDREPGQTELRARFRLPAK